MGEEYQSAGGDSRHEALGAGAVVAGKYRLETTLGRGAMGAVWSATHLGLGERVALKFIAAAFASSPEARHRFETEARATAKIRSRFVVSVFDNGRLPDGTLYLVMECLQGETLQAFVRRAGPLPLAEAVAVARQVGRALGHAHARGVIHRDIKPSNIFLADTPDDGRVAKVLDFGVAKLLSPLDGVDVGQTSAGALLGTPQYMSPEQASGRGDVGPRSDLYSLALVFFFAFTGRPPRAPGPVGEVLARAVTGPMPSPSALRPDAPPALDAWFARACDPEPDGRFPDVDACLAALVNAAGLTAEPWPEPPTRPSFEPSSVEGWRVSALPPLRRPDAAAPGGASEWGPGRSAHEVAQTDRVSVPPSPFRSTPARRAAPWWALGLVGVAVVVGNVGVMLANRAGANAPGTLVTDPAGGERPDGARVDAPYTHTAAVAPAPTPIEASAPGAETGKRPPAAPPSALRPSGTARPHARPKPAGGRRSPDLGY